MSGAEDVGKIAEGLTEAQRGALLWLYGPYKGAPQWREYHSPICGDPSHAALGALVRRDLAEKRGSSGWPTRYQPTMLGLAVKSYLEESSHG